MTYADLDEKQRQFLNKVVRNVAVRWERLCEDRQKAFWFAESLGYSHFFSEGDRDLLSRILWQASQNPGYYLMGLYYSDPYCGYRPDETLALATGKLRNIKSLIESHIPVSSNDRHWAMEREREEQEKQRCKENLIGVLTLLGAAAAGLLVCLGTTIPAARSFAAWQTRVGN